MTSYQRCKVVRFDSESLDVEAKLIYPDATLPAPGDTPTVLRMIGEGIETGIGDIYSEEELRSRADELIAHVKIIAVNVEAPSAIYRIIPTTAGSVMTTSNLTSSWDAAAFIPAHAPQHVEAQQIWECLNIGGRLQASHVLELGRGEHPSRIELLTLMLTDRRIGEVGHATRVAALIALGWCGHAALTFAEEAIFSFKPSHSREELALQFAEWRVLNSDEGRTRVLRRGNDTETLETIIFEGPREQLVEVIEAAREQVKTYLASFTAMQKRAYKRCGITKN